MSDQPCRRGRRALLIALSAAASSMCVVALLPTPADAASAVYTAAGADAAAIQATVDDFRLGLGGVNNGNAPGSLGSGRREINWDGGGAAAPFAAFPGANAVFAFRGNITTTPNTAFSGAPSPRFGNLNPQYADQFTTFSAPRLFGALDTTFIDTVFNVPGDATRPATTSGFGIVFTDVDLPGLTTIEAFNIFGGSLGVFAAETFDRGLSFLGVTFDTPVIARVRVTLGNTPLGTGLNDGDGVDVVAMDDFIYGEPAAVPAPDAVALLALGLGGLGLRRARLG